MNKQSSLVDITFTENGYVDVAQLNALYRLIGWDSHHRRTEAETTAMLSVSHLGLTQKCLMGSENVAEAIESLLWKQK